MKKIHILLIAFCYCFAFDIWSAEVVPPRPARYFNDYASVVSKATVEQLNSALENLEKTDTSQIIVVVYPKMASASSVEDFTYRTAQAWGFGQKEKNNGAVLFVFVQDHKIYIQVGYGLEGVLTDALCRQIIETELKPKFRANDFESGLRGGVDALIRASRGEYKGTGHTNAERRHSAKHFPWWIPIVILMVILSARRRSRGWYYSGGGPMVWGGGGWGSGGGWSSGGGGGSSGGASAGGGNFGGGGAGSDW